MVSSDMARTTVLDATVVIHLVKANRLDLMGSREGWSFVVADQVVEEVRYPEQAEALAPPPEVGAQRWNGDGTDAAGGIGDSGCVPLGPRTRTSPSGHHSNEPSLNTVSDC